MGAVDHIGKLLHLVGPQHRHHRLSGRQILIQPGGDHIAEGLVLPQQVHQHLAAVQPVWHLGGRPGARQVDIGQPVQLTQEGVPLLHSPQQQKSPVGPGLGRVEDGGQVQRRPDGARPAQNGGGHPGHRVKSGGFRLKEWQVQPVGQQSDVGAAGGQPVGQQRRCGKHHICGLGQTALPAWGQLVPDPVAVIDQSAIIQLVQQMDLPGIGGPQQRLREVPALGGLPHKPAHPVPGHLKQQPARLGNREGNGGHRIGRHIGPDLLPLPSKRDVPPVFGGGKI